MLLMFVVGTGSVGWILAHGGGKELAGRPPLAPPLGTVLLLFALSVTIAGAWG
jgi:hypothetical protein